MKKHLNVLALLSTLLLTNTSLAIGTINLKLLAAIDMINLTLVALDKDGSSIFQSNAIHLNPEHNNLDFNIQELFSVTDSDLATIKNLIILNADDVTTTSDLAPYSNSANYSVEIQDMKVIVLKMTVEIADIESITPESAPTGGAHGEAPTDTADTLYASDSDDISIDMEAEINYTELSHSDASSPISDPIAMLVKAAHEMALALNEEYGTHFNHFDREDFESLPATEKTAVALAATKEMAAFLVSQKTNTTSTTYSRAGTGSEGKRAEGDDEGGD